MVLCRFFEQGRCAKGDTCSFEHLRPSSNASTPPFRVPCSFFRKGACKNGVACKYNHTLVDSSSTPQSAPTDLKSKIPCTFYLRGLCFKGNDCPFNHSSRDAGLKNFTEVVAVAQEINPEQPRDKIVDTHAHDRSHPHEQHSLSRTVVGATITFAEGAAVAKVSLPSDFSILAVTGLPRHATLDDIRKMLVSSGVSRHVESIVVKLDSQTAKQSAQVKVADGGVASRNAFESGTDSWINDYGAKINTVQIGESESGTNRLHLSGVTCTWHNPSLSAHLEYGNMGQAKQSLSKLEKKDVEFRGRRPTFVLSSDSRGIKVGNLDVHTSVNDLKQYFKYGPSEIRLGQKSHSKSSKDLRHHVGASLEKCGHVLEWSVTVQPGGSKVKAYAKFSSPDEAVQAVKQLNGSAVEPESNDKLHVQQTVSVKLPVSQRVLKVITTQLYALADTARSAQYVAIKAYDNPLKAYTQIRVSGSDKASVAHVKIQVEKLLAGTIATSGGQPLTHAYFFQGSFTPFLDQVMTLHGVVIVRDRRKMLLRLYGEEVNIHAAQEALLAKIEETNSQTRNILLDSNSLATAVKGGFRLIVAAVGKDRVKLDVTSNPKQIILTGTDREEAKIQEILKSYRPDIPESIADMSIDGEAVPLCAVCWTPAEDAFKTACGHTYCSSCIIAQAASTSTFPLCCLGKSGTCSTPLTLQDLRTVLPATDYEALLESSVARYIRSHPSAFQYCSTPDCDRFYRISAPEHPVAYNCDYCLTSTCTACHGAAHPGQTCEEASSARDGADEFSEWKKQNDARDCPSCGTPIQKSAGCNHMECRSCRAHICWRCMRTFGCGPDVYAHMNRDHAGDWGL
ncbi:hypothetical protein P153DRAFT_297969 [Dothidotthia symphoricarpi CBS 119687]|uniref:RING-type E3 ubiquitin transferase n=1 Tax=Dothidotthia symphoricarpi CBS 119687 TaxID=1392245 RepID=A0A6A6A3H9_9PLEO|nr:uncharacterized protein P153DRAFT_297969 [Dothidotthia symphoricarpi CBS 119687]KAF2126360.1 hypothetical protein P153DRAFT_297969 [Dothidotthia symphoricarpi CBS 119687]